VLVTSHMPCLTGFHGPSHVHIHPVGRYVQYVCRYQGPILRETIKGATTTCDRIGPPIYFYVERRVRYRKQSSSSRSILLSELSFYRPSPCTRKISKHLLGKLTCSCPLARLTNHQSDAATVRHRSSFAFV